MPAPLLLAWALACSKPDPSSPPGSPPDPTPTLGPDRDGDGWAADQECDDTDHTVRPDAAEVAGDRVDNDCDGRVDCDDDDLAPRTLVGDVQTADHVEIVASWCTTTCDLEIDGSVTLVALGEVGEEADDLEAMSCVTAISGDLRVGHNAGLRSVAGLRSLVRVGGDLSVQSRLELQDLRGLSALREIGGDLTLSGLGVHDLDGLQGVSSIGGDVSLYTNAALASLEGFPTVSSVHGDVMIEGATQLESLRGLDALRVVEGRLALDHTGVRSLEGLGALERVGSLDIEYERQLTSLAGLRALRVADHVSLDQLDLLPSLEGLEGLTEIPGWVWVT
jgi:hypothetical protein